jgi:hypothetical protein
MIQIPLEKVHFEPALRAMLLPAAIFAFVVLPWRLSWFLSPREGWRRILAVAVYILLAVLFAIQLLFL